MKGVYSWKIGSHCTGDANKVGAELEAIGDQVTPDAVVAYAAKHKRSELHTQFEWDNETAGHMHRLNQARHLLSCIVIEREAVTPKGKKEVIITRAYENVKVLDNDDNGKRVYIPIDAALTVPEHRKYVIDNIRKAISDLHEKASVYETYLRNATQFNKGLDIALKSV